MQNGSIMRSERRRGPDVWEYRWREPAPTASANTAEWSSDRSTSLGTRHAVFRATSALRRDINMANVRGKGKPSRSRNWRITIAQRELAPSNRWKTHSTKLGYRGYLRKWIIPRWGGYTLTQHSRRRDRALAALFAVSPFHLRQDSQRDECPFQSRLAP